MRAKHPCALTVAGTDPGGGAGIQADLKTFAALRVYGFSAITAVIAQNSSRVSGIEPVSPAMVTAQIELVCAEQKPAAMKTGAMASAEIVDTVATAIKDLKLPAPVVDPVLISSAGAPLLDAAGELELASRLIPLARVVTPNLPEAETLAQVEISSIEGIREAARRLRKMGARAVVIKGGHLAPEHDASDLLYDGRSFIMLTAPRLRVPEVHGTGCAFSAAIAAYLARGRDLETAVRGAKRFVTAAIGASFVLGEGRPLLNHFAQPAEQSSTRAAAHRGRPQGGPRDKARS